MTDDGAGAPHGGVDSLLVAGAVMAVTATAALGLTGMLGNATAKR